MFPHMFALAWMPVAHLQIFFRTANGRYTWCISKLYHDKNCNFSAMCFYFFTKFSKLARSVCMYYTDVNDYYVNL